jgi:hypothetical protein
VSDFSSVCLAETKEQCIVLLVSEYEYIKTDFGKKKVQTQHGNNRVK